MFFGEQCPSQDLSRSKCQVVAARAEPQEGVGVGWGVGFKLVGEKF